MLKALIGLMMVAAVGLITPRPAAAHVSVSIGLPGFGLFIGGPPLAYAPPFVAYGPSVAYAPPIAYAPTFYAPPVVFGASYAPVYGGGYYRRGYGYQGGYGYRGRGYGHHGGGYGGYRGGYARGYARVRH